MNSVRSSGLFWVGSLVWMVGIGAEVPYVDRPFGQEVATHYTVSDGLPQGAVVSMWLDSEGRPVVKTDQGMARYALDRWQAMDAVNGGQPTASDRPEGQRTTQFSRTVSGRQLAGGRDGLFERDGREPWQRVLANDAQGRLWGWDRVLASTYDRDGRVWFGIQAGVACREEGTEWRFYEGKNGLPYNEFTCASPGPNGSVWFGTTKGAIRFDRGNWHYRQGRRWLLDDSVRAIVLDEKDRTWMGTASGVTRIEIRPLTLREKATVYEDEIEHVIKRTTFGYLAPVRLGEPGDRDQVTRGDNDNDGLWTSMYGAGQCFAFAATGDESARIRAEQAFSALRFLQRVTQGGAHSPPAGYVARTVRSSTLPDPNRGRVERDQVKRDTDDRLWKVYEPRWPLSEDGRWYWKSDTSSDELDGHYFFYPLYHDLVASTESEKEEVRKVVMALTDHLIENGFNLTEHDGEPTRWGYFSPENLNYNEDWYVERGLNSLSLLSYLTVAEHLSGEQRYTDALVFLREREAYDSNAMVPKIQRGIGSGNQSDDEMAFMSFYNLLRYTRDDGLRKKLLKAFHAYWTLEEPELNPFFNIAYAACAIGQKVSDPWGQHGVDPWEGWWEDSLGTLKAFPLDRVHWGHSNSHRLDVVRLPRQQAVDVFSSDTKARGVRVDGKVLPVDERSFNHWNTDPFQLDYSGDGRTLACGTVYLLPYYMALYHGYIRSDAP